MVTGSSKIKSRGIYDFYAFYPYRRNMISPLNTIPKPFIKYSEVSNHKYSLDYKRWFEVFDLIMLKIKERLQNGETWKIHRFMGEVALKKKKMKRFKNMFKSMEARKNVYSSKNDYQNYMLLLTWYRRNTSLKHKWTWRVKPLRPLMREVYERADKDIGYIQNTFNDY